MANIQLVYDLLNQFAPFERAMARDNCGILVGDGQDSVTKCLLCLDVTPFVIEEAKKIGANLIVSHHPIIFHAPKRISSTTILYHAIASGMGVICAHTNLDRADGGVNTVLAQKLGLKNIQPLDEKASQEEVSSLAKKGVLEKPLFAQELAQLVKQKLGSQALQYVDGQNKITNVAVCGGSGFDLIYLAQKMRIDAIVSAEVKHHETLDAQRFGITLIDAGHYATEQIVLQPLANYLSNHTEKIQFVVSSNPDILKSI